MFFYLHCVLSKISPAQWSDFITVFPSCCHIQSKLDGARENLIYLSILSNMLTRSPPSPQTRHSHNGRRYYIPQKMRTCILSVLSMKHSDPTRIGYSRNFAVLSGKHSVFEKISDVTLDLRMISWKVSWYELHANAEKPRAKFSTLRVCPTQGVSHM